MLWHNYLALEEHKSAAWSSLCESPMQMVLEEEEWLYVYGQSRFHAKKNSICVSRRCPAPYIWIHIKNAHTEPNSFSCTASQSELVCLSKLGPALVCGLLWFTVWGRWRTGCHFPRGTPPLLYFLIDLTDRHFQVSNYHCGAELIPPSSLPLSPGPFMNTQLIVPLLS